MYASPDSNAQQFIPNLIYCEEVNIEEVEKVPKYHMYGFHCLSNRIVFHFFKYHQIPAATIADDFESLEIAFYDKVYPVAWNTERIDAILLMTNPFVNIIAYQEIARSRLHYVDSYRGAVSARC